MRQFLTEISFANPEWFWAFLLIPLLIAYRLIRRSYNPSLKTNHNNVSRGQISSILIPNIGFALRLLAFAFIILVLARPQSKLSREKVSTEGIDIVLALDISSSMLAMDFQPDRLQAAKDVASEFVRGRPNDRIGLVVFAGESFTQCPITTDHSVVLRAIDELKSGLVEDGTAIGMGLATAVDRLKDSDSRSKVVILLTDGDNNKGKIDPKTAGQIASSLNIRVYTIGVGTKGMAPYPMRDAFGHVSPQRIKVTINEELLEYIATTTGVSYYRATDNKSLENIFAKIDELEKTRIEIASFQKYSERFLPFALIALCLLFLEKVFEYLIFKPYP